MSYDPNTGKAIDKAIATAIARIGRKNTQPGMPQVQAPTVPEMPAAKRASERPGSYSVINPR